MSLTDLLQQYAGMLSRTIDKPEGRLQQLTWLLKAGLVNMQEYSLLLNQVRE